MLSTVLKWNTRFNYAGYNLLNFSSFIRNDNDKQFILANKIQYFFHCWLKQFVRHYRNKLDSLTTDFLVYQTKTLLALVVFSFINKSYNWSHKINNKTKQQFHANEEQRRKFTTSRPIATRFSHKLKSQATSRKREIFVEECAWREHGFWAEMLNWMLSGGVRSGWCHEPFSSVCGTSHFQGI